MSPLNKEHTEHMDNKPTSRERFDSEVKAWQEFLNITGGILAFSLGIGALGTPSPRTNAAISLLFIIAVAAAGKTKFLSLVLMLRNKENRTITEEKIKRKIEREQLGPKNLIADFYLFTLGCLFLAFTISSDRLSKYFPLIEQYINGK
jgi:hypothetical protein